MKDRNSRKLEEPWALEPTASLVGGFYEISGNRTPPPRLKNGIFDERGYREAPFDFLIDRS